MPGSGSSVFFAKPGSVFLKNYTPSSNAGLKVDIVGTNVRFEEVEVGIDLPSPYEFTRVVVDMSEGGKIEYRYKRNNTTYYGTETGNINGINTNEFWIESYNNTTSKTVGLSISVANGTLTLKEKVFDLSDGPVVT